MVGDKFCYTLKIRNDNPVALEDCQVTDQLDGKLEFVSASHGGIYDPETRTVAWDGMSVPAGGVSPVYLEVKAVSAGKIYNEGILCWDGGSCNGNTTVEAWRTYTMTYTDGVEGEIVFPDQGYEGWRAGDRTPEFEGYPVREGYEFTGWAPAVNPRVSPDDADEDGEIIYIATWKSISSPIEFPKTGGIGAVPYAILGYTIISLSGVSLLRILCRRRRRSRK